MAEILILSRGIWKVYVVVEKSWIVFLSRFDFQEGDLWQFVGHVKKANSSCMQMELGEFLDMIFSWPPSTFLAVQCLGPHFCLLL